MRMTSMSKMKETSLRVSCCSACSFSSFGLSLPYLVLAHLHLLHHHHQHHHARLLLHLLSGFLGVDLVVVDDDDDSDDDDDAAAILLSPSHISFYMWHKNSSHHKKDRSM